MVRASFSARAAQVVAFAVLLIARPELVALRQTQDERRVEGLTTSDGGQAQPSDAGAVAATILWGEPMASADRTRDLPGGVQDRLTEFRQRERAFHSALKAPPGATATELGLFEKRVAIERVLFCLFPRKDIARVAAGYASDAEIMPEWEGFADPPQHEAAFIDGLLRDLPRPWLGPYLHLIAGHRKLCASQLAGPDPEAARQALAREAKRQIAHARENGSPLVRVAAEYLLKTERCELP